MTFKAHKRKTTELKNSYKSTRALTNQKRKTTFNIGS